MVHASHTGLNIVLPFNAKNVPVWLLNNMITLGWDLQVGLKHTFSIHLNYNFKTNLEIST